MGLKVAPAELARWRAAGLILPAATAPPLGRLPPCGRRHRRDARHVAGRVALQLPGLKLVSRSNAREHWAVRHRRGVAEANALSAAWLVAGLGGWRPPLPCRVTLTRVCGRRMDGDNLQSAFKALRDALAALLGIDDGDPRLAWRYRQKPGGAAVAVAVGPRSMSVRNVPTSPDPRRPMPDQPDDAPPAGQQQFVPGQLRPIDPENPLDAFDPNYEAKRIHGEYLPGMFQIASDD